MTHEEHSQTTSFQAKLPGGATLALMTKSPMVLINLCLLGGLGYIGTQVIILTNKVEVLNYAVERNNKLTRERFCVEDLRSKGLDTSMCKQMVEAP